jgi:hypothetical protein
MSTNDNPSPKAAVEEPVANRFTPDAAERIARLRELAAQFPDEADPRPLTLAEIRLARRTGPAALEKAALFAEAAPGVSNTVADVKDLRDTIAFEFAYGGVRDEAMVLVRRIDHAILRRKLKAVRTARALYRVGKGYVTLDAGDSMRPHVAEMQRALVRPSRRKRNAEGEPVLTAKK